MPRLAIDWQAIKARLPSVDAPFLVAIPDGGRLALIGMCEMLLWRASYLDGHSYTGDEFDEIRDTIEALTLGLLEGVNMDELIGHVDGLEGQVQQLIDRACCPAAGGTTIAEAETKNTFASGGSIGAVGEVDEIPPAVTISPVGGLDATGIIDLDSDGTIGQTEWDSYLCRLAAWMFDLLLDMMRIQKTGYGQLLTAIDLAAWYGFRLARRVIAGPADDVVLFSLEHLYDMASAMTAEITDTQTDTAIAEMEAARETTICAMAAATTSEEMASALLSNISANITLTAWVTLASAGPWLALSRIIWGSRVDAPDYDCSGCGAVVYDYDATFTFDTTADGWSSGTHYPSFGNPAGSYGNTPTNTSWGFLSRVTGSGIASKAGITLPASIDVQLVEVDIYVNAVWDDLMEIQVLDSTITQQATRIETQLVPGSWVTLTFDFSALNTMSEANANHRITFRAAGLSGGTNDQYYRIDNVRIAGFVA